MSPDQSHQQAANEKTGEKEEATLSRQPLYALPFAIQLQNIFPIEIVARRFPVAIANSPDVQLNTSEIQIDSESSQAQVILEVHVGFSDEPRPFEISYKMLGQFNYTQEYNAEMVYMFLSQGSLSAVEIGRASCRETVEVAK